MPEDKAAQILLPALVEIAHEDEEKHWKIPFLRFVIVALGTLSASVGISCCFAYNFAVVCGIDGETNAKAIYERSPSNSLVMYFSPGLTNLLYSAYPTGNILTLLGLIALGSKVSVRNQVMIGIAISTLATGLIPIAFDYWPTSTLFLKLIQGAGVAPTVPLIGHISAQIGLFFAILSTVLLCLCYFVFEDSPAQHKRISDEEFQIIKPNEEQVVKEKPTVPYGQFFKNASVWAVLNATIGNYNGISPLIVFSSAVLKKAIVLTVMRTANYNAISFLLQLVLKIVSGLISDRWTSVSESFKTRLFNSISCGLAGVLMIATAFLPVQKKVLCAIFITVSQSFIGFNSAGFNKAATAVTKQYAHFTLTLMGVMGIDMKILVML